MKYNDMVCHYMHGMPLHILHDVPLQMALVVSNEEN